MRQGIRTHSRESVPVKSHACAELLALAAEGTADLAGRADHTFFLTLLQGKGAAVERGAGCKFTVRRHELFGEFGCRYLLVLDRAGRRVGRITGTRHLCADDPSLHELRETKSAAFRSLDT